MDRPLNTECAYCQKMFWKRESKKAYVQKKKGRAVTFFCSRACKDRAYRLDSGVDMARPAHYGNGFYARHRQVTKDKCVECGYDEHPEILHIHHIDRDRTNNTKENLEVLCPNCHGLEHLGLRLR